MEILQTPRLSLRCWSTADLRDALALWCDPRVMALLGGPLDGAQVEARLARERSFQEQHGVQYWKLLEIDGARFCGCCGLKPVEVDGATLFELGFHLLPTAWGRGLASEAAGAAAEHGFTRLQLGAIHAGHHPNNAASQHVLEKLGFQRIGMRFYEPTGLDHPWYRLTPDDLRRASARTTFAR